MPRQTQNPWQRRLRRLFFFVGTASTFYFLSVYILDRLREARAKAVKEKKQRDLMKNHFTSLTSTISFTLYALLPTLQPQVFEAYPVEQTSHALQGLSASGASSMSDSIASVNASNNGGGDSSGVSLLLQGQNVAAAETGDIGLSPIPSAPAPASEVHHDRDEAAQEGNPLAASSTSSAAESWASEFQRRDDESGSEIMVGSSVGQPETDDGLSSALSQPISLPTDISSDSASPPSDLSQSTHFHPSPPHVSSVSTPIKSKKELWRDLKVQSLSRTITTAYLLPMLYLLTTSQLAVLARTKYLNDVKASLPESSSSASSRPILADEDEDDLQTPRPGYPPQPPAKKGWFASFSIDSMGLSDFVEGSTSILPNPVALLPTQAMSYLPSFLVSSATHLSPSAATQVMLEEERRALEIQEAETQAEAERLFLTYSWWLLHEGWKGVAARVDGGVERVFASLPLKKELTLEGWERIIKDIRAEVEIDIADGGNAKLYNFVPHLLPSPGLRFTPDLPFPPNPSSHSPYLSDLVDQTRSHLSSPDGRYLLEKGVSAMVRNLLEDVRVELYDLESVEKRRLVDCLPGVNKWGKGVWEGIPDSGVEAILAIPEFEGFAALIFGDWAPR